MSNQGMTFEEFMGHGKRASNQYLKDWKKNKGNNQGEALVWLHSDTPFAAVNRHNFRRIAEVKDKESGRVTGHDIWSENFVCFEPAKVVDEIHFRDKATGARSTPPTICPFCLMDEFVWQLIKQKKIDWKMPMFKFEAPGRTPEYVYAGGMVGLFGAKKLTPEERGEIRTALGIMPRPPFPNYQTKGITVAGVGPAMEDYAFKQNFRPQMQYVFVVADDADLDVGMKVAIESNGLGHALQAAIGGAMKKAQIEKGNPDFGNPIKNPYPFLWQYNGNADNPSEKYRVDCLDGKKPTEKVLNLIRGARPDTSGLHRLPNLTKLRMALEKHCLHKLPWDEFFRAALARYGSGEDAQAEAPGHLPGHDGRPTAAQLPYGSKAQEETMPCDKCGHSMAAHALKCPSCGMEYEDDGGGEDGEISSASHDPFNPGGR